MLHVYEDFYPKRGGIEDHILTLAQTSSSVYRHIVLVAASNPMTRHENVDHIQVIRAASWARYYTPFCPTMPYWIRRLSPAIIHLHHPSPMAFMACLLARSKAPIVVGYHNDIVKPLALYKFYAPFEQAILRRASAIFVGTQSYLDSSAALRAFHAKCHVIPYGIRLEQFSATPESQAQAQASHIRSTYPGPLVLFVGRLCYYKGVEVAIPAMKDVNATLLIVGDGPLASDLRHLTQTHTLTDKVKFVGLVDDSTRNAYYQACDLLILPSTYRSEAFGLVMLQAQAAARPVICSDLPGLATVNNHQTGLLVPPRDATALANAINYLLDRPELRQQLGQAGQEQVKTLYTSELMSSRIEKVYGSITS